MITLIGQSDSIIGFGLCGIKDINEVNSKTKPEEVLDIIRNSKNETIMIDEEIYQDVKALIKNHDSTKNKIYIKIPKNGPSDKDSSSDIDDLVRDTIGVSIKN